MRRFLCRKRSNPDDPPEPTSSVDVSDGAHGNASLDCGQPSPNVASKYADALDVPAPEQSKRRQPRRKVAHMQVEARHEVGTNRNYSKMTSGADFYSKK